jgi:ectoine hydroxylase-related dioxygenase (phytanoyl-CoA dioxygenase family)
MDALSTEERAGHLARIAEQGWTVLESVVPDDLRLELVARIDRAMEAAGTPLGANAFLGRRTRRLFNLLGRDPFFAAVPLFEPVLSVVEGVLDDELLLSSLTAISMGPGQEPQPFHSDDGSIPLPRPHVPIACVAIWALTDFTHANGATRLVPGSHRADHKPGRGEVTGGWVEAEMPAGSVLVYDGSIWHGGGENTTAERRLGIVCNHCAGWVRQEESQLLALPRDYVAGLPARLQRMVGYSAYRGLIGHVDQVDPGTWLDPTAESQMVWARIR